MPYDLCSIPSDWGGTFSQYGTYRSRTWTNTSNYRNVPRNDRPVNNYLDDRQRGSQGIHAGAFDKWDSGVVVVVQQPGLRWTPGELQAKFNDFYGISGFGSFATSCYNDLLMKLIGKVADAKTNMAVSYHEASKTKEMIFDTAKRLDNAYRAFRKGNLRKVADLLNLSRKTSHNNWLAYKYGWMPLLMDVKGTAELFAQHVLGRPPEYVVTVGKEFPFYYEKLIWYATYGGGEASNYMQTLKGSYTCRMKLWCSLTNRAQSALQQMGLTNPALLLWEAIPFSFVFDWFYSVGDYLTRLTAFDGITVKRALVSNVNDLQYTYRQPTTVVPWPHVTYYNYSKAIDWHQRSYNRRPLVFDVLSLTPPLKLDVFGFAKMTTSLALLRGQHVRFART